MNTFIFNSENVKHKIVVIQKIDKLTALIITIIVYSFNIHCSFQFAALFIWNFLPPLTLLTSMTRSALLLKLLFFHLSCFFSLSSPLSSIPNFPRTSSQLSLIPSFTDWGLVASFENVANAPMLLSETNENLEYE